MSGQTPTRLQTASISLAMMGELPCTPSMETGGWPPASGDGPGVLAQKLRRKAWSVGVTGTSTFGPYTAPS